MTVNNIFAVQSTLSHIYSITKLFSISVHQRQTKFTACLIPVRILFSVHMSLINIPRLLLHCKKTAFWQQKFGMN